MRKFLAIILMSCISTALFTSCGSGKEPAVSTKVESSSAEIPSQKAEATPEPTTEATQDSSEPIPESTPAPTQPPEEQPIGDPETIEELTAVFDAALDYLVPEEELDAAAMVSNAIINATTYKILEVDGNMCKIYVQYPDAATAFLEAFSKLSPEASDEEVDKILMDLAQKIENHKVEMLEKTFYPSVIEQDGLTNIHWGYDLYDAFTGGFYNIEIDE